MKQRYLACLLVLMAAAGPTEAQRDSSAGDSPAAAASDDHSIAELVKQLGDDRWRVRDEATRQLIRIGKRAVPAVRSALTDKNLEVSMRARIIIDTILDLTPEGMARLRGEIGAAFGRANYRQMLDLARQPVELGEKATMLDWLWLGHASQLAGDWPGAVKAYQKVVSLIDADLASGIKEIVAPGGLERPGPVGLFPFTPSERKDLVNRRTVLTQWIAKMQSVELKDPNAAAKSLLAAVACLEASKTEMDYIWQKTLDEVPEAQIAAGDLPSALLSWQKLQDVLATAEHRFVGNRRANVEAIAESIAAWPAGKPLPNIPWVFVLTEDSPSAKLMLDEEATRRRSYRPSANPNSPGWRYAFAPQPGKEFRTLEFACDIEQIKVPCGGHFTCFVTTGGDSAYRKIIGRIDWPDERTGRKTIRKTFEIPAGVKLAEIETGTCEDYFNIRGVDAKATFRDAAKNAPPMQADSRMQTEVWPKGGKLNWGGMELRDERAYTQVAPRRDKLRYVVPGREDRFEADFEVRPGGRYGIFVNLDSPFRWTQTNLVLGTSRAIALRLSVARLKAGGYLAAWCGDHNRIMLARSDDLVTWSRPEPAPFNSVFDNVEPATFADADGTVWLAYFSNRLAFQESSTSGYGLWITGTRDGKAWSPIRPISVGRVSGLPIGGLCMLRGPGGKAWIFGQKSAGAGESFGDIQELRPIVLKDVDDGAIFPRNPHVTVDANKRFHMAFHGGPEGIYYSTSDNGLEWEKPGLVVKRDPNADPEDPQLIRAKDGALLLYSCLKGSFILPVDLSGKPAQAATGLKITNYEVPLGGSRISMDGDGRVFIIAGENTTWLLQAKIEEMLNRVPGNPNRDGAKSDPATRPSR